VGKSEEEERLLARLEIALARVGEADEFVDVLQEKVCCSVLQCVAVCCSVLQCAAVYCSVLQCVAVCFSVLQCVAVCCSVF